MNTHTPQCDVKVYSVVSVHMYLLLHSSDGKCTCQEDICRPGTGQVHSSSSYNPAAAASLPSQHAAASHPGSHRLRPVPVSDLLSPSLQPSLLSPSWNTNTAAFPLKQEERFKCSSVQVHHLRILEIGNLERNNCRFDATPQYAYGDL